MGTLAFRRLGGGLALVAAQGLERQARVPQVNPVHGDRRLGKGQSGAVSGSQHLGGAGRGQQQGIALRMLTLEFTGTVGGGFGNGKTNSTGFT